MAPDDHSTVQPFNYSTIAQVLGNDGVIAFVTDTVWGLGCLPTSEKAVKKIYEIKKREAKKPLILMSNDVYPLLRYVEPIPKTGHVLIKKHFPGALTLVLKKSELTPDYLTSGMDTVGIRVPDNEVFRQICEIVPGNVLATTSANLSNQPAAITYEQALENMGDLVDLVVPCEGAKDAAAGVSSADSRERGGQANTTKRRYERNESGVNEAIFDCTGAKGIESTVAGVFDDEIKIFRQGAINL